MFDPMSTQFSAVQRESHRDKVGQLAHDRETYTVLYGDGSEPPKKKWRMGRAAAGVMFVVALIVLLYVIAPFG